MAASHDIKLAREAAGGLPWEILHATEARWPPQIMQASTKQVTLRHVTDLTWRQQTLQSAQAASGCFTSRASRRQTRQRVRTAVLHPADRTKEPATLSSRASSRERSVSWDILSDHFDDHWGS